MLLGLSPEIDHHGCLLRIDFYAIRAKEYMYLLDFIHNFGEQIYAQVN